MLCTCKISSLVLHTLCRKIWWELNLVDCFKMQNKFGGFSTIDLRASVRDITQHDMYATHV